MTGKAKKSPDAESIQEMDRIWGLWMTIALLAALELAVMAVIRKRRSR